MYINFSVGNQFHCFGSVSVPLSRVLFFLSSLSSLIIFLPFVPSVSPVFFVSLVSHFVSDFVLLMSLAFDYFTVRASFLLSFVCSVSHLYLFITFSPDVMKQLKEGLKV